MPVPTPTSLSFEFGSSAPPPKPHNILPKFPIHSPLPIHAPIPIRVPLPLPTTTTTTTVLPAAPEPTLAFTATPIYYTFQDRVQHAARCGVDALSEAHALASTKTLFLGLYRDEGDQLLAASAALSGNCCVGVDGDEDVDENVDEDEDQDQDYKEDEDDGGDDEGEDGDEDMVLHPPDEPTYPSFPNTGHDDPYTVDAVPFDDDPDYGLFLLQPHHPDHNLHDHDLHDLHDKHLHDNHLHLHDDRQIVHHLYQTAAHRLHELYRHLRLHPESLSTIKHVVFRDPHFADVSSSIGGVGSVGGVLGMLVGADVHADQAHIGGSLQHNTCSTTVAHSDSGSGLLDSLVYSCHGRSADSQPLQCGCCCCYSITTTATTTAPRVRIESLRLEDVHVPELVRFYPRAMAPLTALMRSTHLRTLVLHDVTVPWSMFTSAAGALALSLVELEVTDVEVEVGLEFLDDVGVGVRRGAGGGDMESENSEETQRATLKEFRFRNCTLLARQLLYSQDSCMDLSACEGVGVDVGSEGAREVAWGVVFGCSPCVQRIAVCFEGNDDDDDDVNDVRDEDTEPDFDLSLLAQPNLHTLQVRTGYDLASLLPCSDALELLERGRGKMQQLRSVRVEVVGVPFVGLAALGLESGVDVDDSNFNADGFDPDGNLDISANGDDVGGRGYGSEERKDAWLAQNVLASTLASFDSVLDPLASSSLHDISLRFLFDPTLARNAEAECAKRKLALGRYHLKEDVRVARGEDDVDVDVGSLEIPNERLVHNRVWRTLQDGLGRVFEGDDGLGMGIAAAAAGGVGVEELFLQCYLPKLARAACRVGAGSLKVGVEVGVGAG